MAQRICLDYPAQETIDSPVQQIMGWCTTDSADTQLSIFLNGRRLEHGSMERGDVRRAFPDVPSFGFSYWLSPEDCLAIGDRELALEFILGETRVEKIFRYSPSARQRALDWLGQKQSKRNWCLSVLQCPACRAGRPFPEANGSLRCPACNELLEQKTSALNLLPAELYGRFHLKPTDLVSSHPYPDEVEELIREVRLTNGKILDCGAGFRGTPNESVVTVEIVDYASTDVLAVGQSLPFADGSFDAALSLAVLEHVDDPFACSAELARVVKPGGKIICAVPFMTHEHGYPNHFYNMTRHGVRKLFEGKARLLSHEVPRYGAPIHALCSFVDEYAAHLPAASRAEFEKLTVGDLRHLPRGEYWHQSYVRQLSEEGTWLLAAMTTAVFERNPG